jgi:hypothetical protein
MKQFLYSIIFLMFSIFIFAQNIYEESRYQLMINYKLNDRYFLSFQPDMRVNNFTEKITITLWRLLFIRKWNEKIHSHIGADWFNNWYDCDVVSNELRAHLEIGFKDKYGKWTYSNRYRLDYRNHYTSQWEFEKSVVRIRYMMNWSRDLYHNENNEQKITLSLADEVFLNIAGTSHFSIYDQNRLGGYLVYKINSLFSIRSTYWWEYRGKNDYNHQWWIQLVFDF